MRILFLCLCSFLFADARADLKFEVGDYLPEIWGWCSREKADSFIDLIFDVKPEVCAEIGVFAGASVFPVASALKRLGRGVLIAIDPWDIVECLRYFHPDQHQKDIRWWAKTNMDHIYFAFLNLLRQFELEKTCIVLKMTSKKAASLIAPIDILHIDGTIFEQAAVDDVQMYLPKVRPGGYIWLNNATSLQSAVHLLLEHCDPIKVIDGGQCILFRKR